MTAHPKLFAALLAFLLTLISFALVLVLPPIVATHLGPVVSHWYAGLTDAQRTALRLLGTSITPILLICSGIATTLAVRRRKRNAQQE